MTRTLLQQSVEIEVQLEHVNPRLAQEAEELPFGVPGHHGPDGILRHASSGRDAGDLVLRPRPG